VSSKTEVELKGGMYTFMSLQVHSSDLSLIDKALADKVQQAPGFFKDTPVVVDLTQLTDAEDAAADVELDTDRLLRIIRDHKLTPIVASVRHKSSPIAESIALPLIEGKVRHSSSAKNAAPESASSTEKDSDAKAKNTDSDKQEKSSEASSSSLKFAGQEVEYIVKAPQLVTRPVRSGQQIYARDTDLIVMGQIGPGAEVIADNNIHVYGPLRGRALCGVTGNRDSRIFCQSLEAELVSVAGNYRLLESIPEELRGKPAQIWLDEDRLNIEPL